MEMKLKIGDKAPNFKGTDQNNNEISLKDFKGKKLVLYFYPKDNTPTCTVQACNIRDNYSDLQKSGISIIGISPDNEKSHQNFSNKHTLPFPIIADSDSKMINDYGVWGEKQLYGRKYMGLHRTTFLINEKGKIVHIITKPKSKEHVAEIIKAWEQIDL